jgi:hypothetical protein
MATREHPSAEDVAIARKIVANNAASIAIVPAKPLHDETWPVLLRLGRALRLLASRPVGLVRGAPREWANGGADPVERGPNAYRLKEVEGFEVVELVLPASGSLGEAAANLGAALRQATGNFGHLLIDYDGYLPDVREVLELPDLFVSAAAAGRTRERDLRALVDLLPTSRHLGTLLLD